jgi:hypothetical protein
LSYKARRKEKLPNLPNLPKYANVFWPDVPKSKHERRVSRDGGEMAPETGWDGTLYKKYGFYQTNPTEKCGSILK